MNFVRNLSLTQRLAEMGCFEIGPDDNLQLEVVTADVVTLGLFANNRLGWDNWIKEE